MEISDIQKLEYSRTLENISTIYLIKDGPTSPWYKAYEWSAYLLENYNKELNQQNKLKPIHIQYKDFTLINVNLQFKSLQKYLPNIAIDESQINNDYLTINLNLNINNQENIEKYKDIINNWKNNIPFFQYKQKQNTIYSQPSSFSHIMKEILSYQEYGKTQDDLLNFIYSLKIKCANLI